MIELFTSAYGSHLYGTATPTSDTDNKVVYLPSLDNILLGKKPSIFKKRFDEDGNPIFANDRMPDNGLEIEYIPFQTFCNDFFNGQTYALEVAFAKVDKLPYSHWLRELINNFLTKNVSSMAGFAKKQTSDYVHRGARLKKAKALLADINRISDCLNDERVNYPDLGNRLDTTVPTTGKTVLDLLQATCNAELGATTNNNKVMRTLRLNGRDYLETTDIYHFRTALVKLIDSYGHRSEQAGELDVDLKSLSHAVRVYDQSKELLETGKLVFPRHNAAHLLKIKNGKVPLEQVKKELIELELLVEELKKTNKTLVSKSPELEIDFNNWLLLKLRREMYHLP